MDEFKIIFWIIIVLVYIFTRSKKKVAQRPVEQPTEQEADAPDRPMTFEELLKEIQSTKEVAAPAPRRPEPIQPPASILRPAPSAAAPRKQLEDADYDYRSQDKIYEIYDKATQQAFNRPSLEETMKLEDTIVRFRQFKSYEKDSKPSLAQEYAKDLRDPANFKKAFILSEILSRRF